MKHFKSLGLAVLAALALTAIAGASMASASEPQAEGGIPSPFTGHGGTGQLFITPNPDISVHCTASTSSGEISNATTAVNVLVKFTGCTGPAGVPCQSSGAAAKEIRTTTLHGTLVYLETNSTKAGILLKPAVAGGNFATFVCSSIFGNTTISVKGEVLGEITPVNEGTTTFTLHFAQSSKGHPLPNSYLSNVGCNHISTTESLRSTGVGLFNFENRPSSIVGTQTLTTEKHIKINSTKCI